MPRRFRAILAQEGVETDEGILHRRFDEGAFTWRTLPLTMLAQTTTPEFGGHAGAFVAGRIDEIAREDSFIVATGVLDDGTDQTAEVVRMVEERYLTGVSVDPGSVIVEEEIRDTDEDGWPTDVLLNFVEYQIGAATIVSVPALEGTLIELLDEEPASDASEPAEDEEAVAASALQRLSLVAAGGPDIPPAAWFDDPQLDALTPLTIADDGRIFGHLAPWGDCHIGFEDSCSTAPTSAANYAYFRTGETEVACDTGDRCRVPTGVITMGTGHASLRDSATAAAEHYDNTGTVVADVAAGEDDHGIWIAGALRPGLTDGQIRELRAAGLSGDWRRIGGQLELVAALAVNVPGFPVPRVRVASGEPLALVAAAGSRAVHRRPEPWQQAIDALRSEILEHLETALLAGRRAT